MTKRSNTSTAAPGLQIDAAASEFDISFWHAQAFSVAAELLSIKAAAQRLHLTPSGMSRVIKDLESAVGVRLFERKPQGLALTAAGQAFQPYAQRLAECYADTLDLSRSSASNHLILAASNVVLPLVLPALLKQMNIDQDKPSIMLRELPNHQVISQVDTAAADLGLYLSATYRNDAECLPLLRVPLGLLASKRMQLPQFVPDLNALAHLPMARLSDDLVLPQALRAHHVAFDAYFAARVVSNRMPALFSAVASGQVVTLASAMAACNAPQQDMQFVPLPHLLPHLHLCLVGRVASDWQRQHATWIHTVRTSVFAVAWPEYIERL
jgi:DNA-binding transcriptional LysR family regulator